MSQKLREQSSLLRIRASWLERVHPRWRGEHEREGNEEEMQNGSSPLARGTLPVRQNQRLHARFIPAGAGNTPLPAPPAHQSAVHPRWRGEHRRLCRAGNSGCGSSPLARGTLAQVAKMNVYQRFIPAGAGNTKSFLIPVTMWPVHPRWRGEHVSMGVVKLSPNGSSPLARGTRPGHCYLERGRRFIPAGAGNTGDGPARC